MSRPLPLALAHRPRSRVVDIPVSRAERDAFLALERQGVNRDLIFRVVLPLVRADQRATEGRRLIDRLTRRIQ